MKWSAFMVACYAFPSAVEAFCVREGRQHPDDRARSTLASPRHASVDGGQWLGMLKLFDGPTLDFDVIEKTKQYTSEPGYRSFQLAKSGDGFPFTSPPIKLWSSPSLQDLP